MPSHATITDLPLEVVYIILENLPVRDLIVFTVSLSHMRKWLQLYPRYYTICLANCVQRQLKHEFWLDTCVDFIRNLSTQYNYGIGGLASARDVSLARNRVIHIQNMPKEKCEAICVRSFDEHKDQFNFEVKRSGSGSQIGFLNNGSHFYVIPDFKSSGNRCLEVFTTEGESTLRYEANQIDAYFIDIPCCSIAYFDYFREDGPELGVLNLLSGAVLAQTRAPAQYDVVPTLHMSGNIVKLMYQLRNEDDSDFEEGYVWEWDMESDSLVSTNRCLFRRMYYTASSTCVMTSTSTRDYLIQMSQAVVKLDVLNKPSESQVLLCTDPALWRPDAILMTNLEKKGLNLLSVDRDGAFQLMIIDIAQPIHRVEVVTSRVFVVYSTMTWVFIQEDQFSKPQVLCERDGAHVFFDRSPFPQ